MNEKEYWNQVERAQMRDGILHDNFQKKRMIAASLLPYDFTNKRVVELGSGNGLLASIVSSAVGRMKYSGVDISESYASLAKKIFGLPVVVADAREGLPFNDNSADAIWAFDSLEHIHERHYENLFKEFDRVLDKNRMMFINNPLTVSQHPPEFDFEFTMRHLGQLCEATNMIIVDAKILKSGSYRYQFIVLSSYTKELV